jgi:hypothetical protein
VCGYPPAPFADEIATRGRKRASVAIDPGDLDAGETHRFEVVTPPGHGEVELAADGTLTYRAEKDFVGEDSVIVRVTDSSEWGLSGEVTIPISVEEGGACNGTGGVPVWWAWVALVGLRRRR